MFPPDVTTWLTNVFSACNRRLSSKLSNNPNVPEESLDMTWIEHVSQYSAPVVLSSSWTVKLEAHYLGALRHFGGWEVADVGMLLFVKRAGKIVRSKVALLQSKRLYPTTNTVKEEHKIDYEIGFARLADPEILARSIAVEAEFEFNAGCKYGALKAGSKQVHAIDAFTKRSGMAVYYQLYNPWAVPFVRRIPLAGYSEPEGEPQVGTRIVPASVVHRLLATQKDGWTPTRADLGEGWRLEDFVGGLFPECRAGTPFDRITDENIQTLFYRRSGPISAAIAITIEAPSGSGD